MSIRNVTFVNDGYYHVFNRGVDKRAIFLEQGEQEFFLHRLVDLNNVNVSIAQRSKRQRNDGQLVAVEGEELVSVVAYCLLPNHFHLLLKQNVDDGISKFMQRLGTSYVKFFNKKHERMGSLFQGKFKATQLAGNYALPKVASYVNLNYMHHQLDIAKHLVKSSMSEYTNNHLKTSVCDHDEISKIIEEVGGLEQYKEIAKNASITYASNKQVVLKMKDFEF